MRPVRLLVVIAILAVPGLWPSVGAAGLYDDEAKNVTGGDLNSQDYWWAKFDDMMLDRCIKAHQPEGRIGLQLVGMTKRLDDLEKQYPSDEELKKMKAHADGIEAKVDPNAMRSTSFGPECPWEESN